MHFQVYIIILPAVCDLPKNEEESTARFLPHKSKALSGLPHNQVFHNRFTVPLF